MLNQNAVLNIIVSIILAVLSVVLILRWYKLKGKVIIRDQQWSTVRIMFLALGLLSFVSLIMNKENTLFDYMRIVATIVAVTVFMMMRDGVGEQGMVSGGKLYPWSEVRSWDYEERKNVVAVYFTLESQKKNKPDDYTSKELDFANYDKANVLKFMRMNQGRKYTRMKKRS